jgi:putative membrane protein
MATALMSPIDRWSDVLFAAHMTQHELLMLVAAPLIALGRPGRALLWLLGPGERLRAGRAIRRLAPTWRRVTNLVVVFSLHAAVIWLSHVPSLFNAALADDVLHAAVHALMMFSAVLFWWALVEGRYGSFGYGAALVFVFGTSLHTGLLGAGFTFAPAVIYAPYARSAPAAGVDPLWDQQLAGLLMWIPAGVVFMLTGLGLLAAWVGASEKRTRVAVSDAHR